MIKFHNLTLSTLVWKIAKVSVYKLQMYPWPFVTNGMLMRTYEKLWVWASFAVFTVLGQITPFLEMQKKICLFFGTRIQICTARTQFFSLRNAKTKSKSLGREGLSGTHSQLCYFHFWFWKRNFTQLHAVCCATRPEYY